MVGDVDALQGLYLRGLGAAARRARGRSGAASSATAIVLPAAAASSRSDSCSPAWLVPGAGGAADARRAAVARAPPAAELTAELVELLRGAPELVVYGREEDTLAAYRAADATSSSRLGRRDALAAGLADSLSMLVAGLTVAGVLAVASAHDAGGLDRVLVATLALLALASFEAVAPLPARRARALRDGRRRPARARADRPRAGGARSGRAAPRCPGYRQPSRSRA